MKADRKCLAVMVLLWMSCSHANASDSAPITVSVDFNKRGAPIHADIYGQFQEHIGRGIYEGIWVGEGSQIPNIHGYRKDVVDALKAIHIPVLRWPGGCYADQYDWRDGIGPRDLRPKRINMLWGKVIENNEFGTHEFFNLVELLGTQAYLTLNMGTLSPLDAQRWLEYITSDSSSSLANERRANGRLLPWTIKYVGLGNETWGCGGEMRADYAADTTRRFSYFLNPLDEQPFVKVASGPTAELPKGEEFAEAIMKNAKGLFGELLFNAMSLHYYAGPVDPDGNRVYPALPALGFSENEWTQYLVGAMHMETAISRVAAIMDKYDPEKKISLVVDEWGAAHTTEPGTDPHDLYQQNTILDAVVAALTLNIIQRHTDRVAMANISNMINVGQALILTDKERMVRTPTYHVFDMYQPFRGAVPLEVSVTDNAHSEKSVSWPMVDGFAARGVDGRVHLSLVNLDPKKAADVLVNVPGRAYGQLLTGPALDSHNSFEQPDAVHPVALPGVAARGYTRFHLPARSIAVVEFDGEE
jgi:alpha-N-arabinofuranosidase